VSGQLPGPVVEQGEGGISDHPVADERVECAAMDGRSGRFQPEAEAVIDEDLAFVHPTENLALCRSERPAAAEAGRLKHRRSAALRCAAAAHSRSSTDSHRAKAKQAARIYEASAGAQAIVGVTLKVPSLSMNK